MGKANTLVISLFEANDTPRIIERMTPLTKAACLAGVTLHETNRYQSV